MKKLLALILCVMMFVAVIPTSAFAASHAGLATDLPLKTVNQYTNDITNMIKNTRTNIQTAYEILAMNETVYGAAKGMDDILMSLVAGIADPLVNDGRMTTAQRNTVKDSVRALFDNLVSTEIANNTWKYMDSNGKVNYLKKTQVYADAVQAALTNKSFQKGYQAVATYFALANLLFADKGVNDQLHDTYTDFFNSIDADFDKDFAAKYPLLAETYIDSVAEGVALPPIFDMATQDVDPWAHEVLVAAGAIDAKHDMP